MTVLNRSDARGFDTKRARNYLVGLAMVVVGVGAAFGISQVVDGDGATTYSGPLVERSQAMQNDIDALIEGARAQTAGAVPAASAGWTLQQELAAIQARTGVEQAAPTVTSATSTLQNELNAIQARTGVEQAGATINPATEFTLEDELAALHSQGTATQSDSSRADFEKATGQVETTHHAQSSSGPR